MQSIVPTRAEKQQRDVYHYIPFHFYWFSSISILPACPVVLIYWAPLPNATEPQKSVNHFGMSLKYEILIQIRDDFLRCCWRRRREKNLPLDDGGWRQVNRKDPNREIVVFSFSSTWSSRPDLSLSLTFSSFHSHQPHHIINSNPPLALLWLPPHHHIIWNSHGKIYRNGFASPANKKKKKKTILQQIPISLAGFMEQQPSSRSTSN